MMPLTRVCNSCGADNQPRAVYCRSCGYSLQAVKPTIYHSTTGRLLANVLLKQRYRVITPIGTGGMGAVYKAEDIQLGNRQVALKEMSQSGLNPQEQKEAADAFKQEAIILAHLQHPNLPSIFDHFEENGRWYLVMSFIEGETLEGYFSHAPGGKLPPDEAVEIGIQLCTVLGYLHNQQPAIIFRDLKLTNIMRMPDGHIYLIDFGIARHFKPGQTRDTAYYGSMGYAPPEQYGKAQTTPRSDIYSLGVTLYQLLSGHDPSSSPFHFPPLQSLVPTVPSGLATLITQMIELDEKKRPASIPLVKQALQALASPAAQKFNSSPSTLPGTPAPLTVPERPPTARRQESTPRPQKKGSLQILWLVIIVSLVGLVAVGGIVLATSHPTPSPSPSPSSQPQSFPQLASSYTGTVDNTTFNQDASLVLFSITEDQQGNISGQATVGSPLAGSGSFTGTVSINNSINFTLTANDGSGVSTTFTGTVNPQNSLSGNYTVNNGQVGTWQVNKS